MRIVVALGGNALLERGERPDADIQHVHVRAAAQALAPLAIDHQLVICHGNGPQVGLLALESESDRALTAPYPLDVLGAQTQGMIGYWLAQELRNAGVAHPVVSLITQTVVAAEDPAFSAPTKFIGPVYSQHHAHRLAVERHWTIAADGAHWRRVVPSPQPESIVEMSTIKWLADQRAVIVCGGGGGVPVLRNEGGDLVGVEAVVDKDLTAALIAEQLHADLLLILTDVTSVMKDFGTDHARAVRDLDVDQLDGLSFPAGSMGPKIEACTGFVRATGKRAAIGALPQAAEIVAGQAGTRIYASVEPTPGAVAIR